MIRSMEIITQQHGQHVVELVDGLVSEDQMREAQERLLQLRNDAADKRRDRDQVAMEADQSLMRHREMQEDLAAAPAVRDARTKIRELEEKIAAERAKIREHEAKIDESWAEHKQLIRRRKTLSGEAKMAAAELRVHERLVHAMHNRVSLSGYRR